MTPSLPLALKIVAVLFILGGISTAIEIVLSLMMGHININFGLLGIFIGIGLLRRSNGWRACALVFTWLALALVPIVGLLFLAHSGPLNLNFFGQKVAMSRRHSGLECAPSSSHTRFGNFMS